MSSTLTTELTPKTKLKLEKNTIKYAEKIRELEGKNSIVPFRDPNAVFRKLPGILFDYQKRFIEAALNSAYECLVWEKSRRIGATHALAAYAVLEASKGNNPKNFFYIGTSLPMARDFIASCAYWCKHFNVIAKTRDHPIIDKESENILVLRINFKSGKRIEALSSRPESMRGRQGNVLIDEASFITGLSEFLKACMAMQIWKCKVFILSTHNGVDNPFNTLCEEIRKGEKDFYLQRTTLREAVNQGLYERICLMEGIPHTLEEQKRWLEKLYHDAGDAATEEYDAIPKSSSENAIFRAEHFIRIAESDLPKSWDFLGRFWDFASTDKDTSCYSVGILMGIKKGKKYILDWKYCRKNPSDSEDFYFDVTRRDGTGIVSAFELEGGSFAPKYEQHMKKSLPGFHVRGIRPEGGKTNRALPCAKEVKDGNYYIVEAEWTDKFLKTIQLYTANLKSPLITDSVDSLSGCHNTFTRKINYLLNS
jgi:predicted phage terminase large subunit-like protein